MTEKKLNNIITQLNDVNARLASMYVSPELPGDDLKPEQKRILANQRETLLRAILDSV